MAVNTNTWNKIRYTLYAPIYDFVVQVFEKYRKQSVALLQLKGNEKILILGAGTGSDLKYLPATAQVYAIDITPAMVSRIREKAKDLNLNVEAKVMDGQNLEYPDQYFDVVILNLILAVIPDPIQSIKEAERVLKSGGKAVVFDKFLPDNANPGFLRRFFNKLTNFFFSDINRKLADIIKPTSFQKVKEKPAAFNGVFKLFLLKKP